MKKGLVAVLVPVLAIFALASSSAMADGRGRGTRSVGVWPGSAYPAWRGHYGGWRGAYRAPAVGFYFGGPFYGGAWPYAYRYPYGYGYAPYVVPYTAYVVEEPVVYVERAGRRGHAGGREQAADLLVLLHGSGGLSPLRAELQQALATGGAAGGHGNAPPARPIDRQTSTEI
jgi:hypothetical protein